MKRWLALLPVVALVGCGEEGGGENSRGGGNSKAPFKTDSEIEREIAESLDKRPYNELLYTPLSIDCSGISENLEANRNTRCTARDARGNTGTFTVQDVGGSDYEFSPGEVTQALSFGS